MHLRLPHSQLLSARQSEFSANTHTHTRDLAKDGLDAWKVETKDNNHTMNRRVFLSAATDDYGDFRLALAQSIRESGVDVEYQETLPQTGADTIEKLATKIETCGLVVHIVGHKLGAVADATAVEDFWRTTLQDRFLANLPKVREALGDFTTLTYTQWEAFLAFHLGITVLVYSPNDAFDSEGKQILPNFEQKTHLDRLILNRRRPSPFIDQTQLMGKIHAHISYFFWELRRRMEESLGTTVAGSDLLRLEEKKLKPSNSIPARKHDSNTVLNLLMRWSYFQRSAVVLLKTDYSTEFIVDSFVHADYEGQSAAKQVNKTIPSRVWIKLSGLPSIKSVTDPAEIVQALTQAAALGSNEKARIENGKVPLGMVIDSLPDLSPNTIAQLQMWLDSVRAAFPGWEPLIVLVHAMQEAAAATAARSLTGVVECLNTMADFTADSTQIVPARTVSDLGSHGIGALLSLAWHDVLPSDLERTAMTKLMPWLSQAPEVVPAPLRAGGVVGQLEAMDGDQARDLATVLCEWLIGYQPRLAAAVFQSLAGASLPALPIIAARAAMDHPSIMDAWLVGVPGDRRSQVIDDVSAQCPVASGCIAAAWVRGVLRGQLTDVDTCLGWIRLRCRSLVPVVEAVLPTVDRIVLLNLLKSNAAAGHFHWLGEIASCLDVPLEDVDDGARQRIEYWKLVQSIPADSIHLRRVFSLPSEELVILGCYGTGADSPSLQPAAKAHAERLRLMSLS